METPRTMFPEQELVFLGFEAMWSKHQALFQELLAAVKSTGEPFEGNVCFNHLSFEPVQDRTKMWNLFLLARKARTMLEIGFNAGHSASIALLANPTLHLVSVDLGEHKYSHLCAEILRKWFPGRFQLVLGDSREVLANVRGEFELLHIDGGHSCLVAHNDLWRCLRLATQHAMVVMDDTQKPHLASIWEHWSAVLETVHAVFPSPAGALSRHSIGLLRSNVTLTQLDALFLEKQKEFEAVAEEKRVKKLKQLHKRQKRRQRAIQPNMPFYHPEVPFPKKK